MKESKNQTKEKSEDEPIPISEWITAGLGLAFVCLCLVFLLYRAFTMEDRDPEVAFEVTDIVQQDGRDLVLAKVSNQGGKTITALRIRGTVGMESGDVGIDFLPARSSRNFGMFFADVDDPSEVTFSSGGYQEP